MDSPLNRSVHVDFRTLARQKSVLRPTPDGQTATKTAARDAEVERQFAWVDWVLSRTGLSDTTLAKGAGLEPNYIYRKRNKTLLNAAHVRQIIRFTGLAGPDTYMLPGAGAGLSEEASAFDPRSDGDPELADMVRSLLSSRPNAGSWTLKTHAIQKAGYFPGDIVIVDRAVLARAGDAVAAQLYDIDTGTAETIFRILEKPYLVAFCDDPALRQPIEVDDNRAIVVGTITHCFRGRRRA